MKFVWWLQRQSGAFDRKWDTKEGIPSTAVILRTNETTQINIRQNRPNSLGNGCLRIDLQAIK